MTRRLHLHIGTMKSGTTFVQGMLEESKDLLAAEGLLWPTADLRYHAIRQLLGSARYGGNQAWRTVADELSEHQGDAVFSNELLAALDSDQVGTLVAALPVDEIQLIVTVRHLARMLPSHWQSKVKDGWSMPWAEFAAGICAGSGTTPSGASLPDWFWQRHDVPAILARWTRHLPVEQMTVVTVPAASGSSDALAARFGEAIGVDPARLSRPAAVNQSLGAWSVELLRRMNADARARGDDRFTPKAMLAPALIGRSTDEPPYGLDGHQLDWAHRRAEQMRDELVALGAPVIGDLEELVVTLEPAEGSVDPGAATDAQLLSAATGGLLGLVDGVLELRTELDEARSETRRASRAVPRLKAANADLRRRLRATDASRRPGPLRRLRRRAGAVVRRVSGRLDGGQPIGSSVRLDPAPSPKKSSNDL